MWKTIKGWFGWAEHELEDVVSDFHVAINRLEALVSRKQKTAETKTEAAAKAQNEADKATLQAAHASTVRDKLRDLIGTSPAVS